jgi:protocatechuate 3,4-dioxygenase beta subunit
MSYSAGTNGHWEKERLAEVTSDSAGLAQIERIQTNTICVSVTAEGYAPRQIVQQNLLRPLLLKLSAELARAASIDGIVVDDAGKPVSGANVRPMVQLSSDGLGYDNGLHYEPFDKSIITTDAEGRFEFRELPTGYVQFHAQAQGYYFADSRTTFNVPSNHIVLHLRAAGDVSVAVTDKDGKPISKYEGNLLIVNIDPTHSAVPDAWSSMAIVNEEGRCIFHNMPPGEYRVTSRPNPGHDSPSYPSAQFVGVLPGKGTAITLIYK